MPIITNRRGDVFEHFYEVSEDEILTLKLDDPLAFALVIAKYEENFLLLYNKGRQEWEIPGGMIEEGESCRDCAIRELLEETNQRPERITFNGLMKLNLHNGKTEYGALYSVRMMRIEEFLMNDEALEIVFWNGINDFTNINEIDKKLLEYYKEP